MWLKWRNINKETTKIETETIPIYRNLQLVSEIDSSILTYNINVFSYILSMFEIDCFGYTAAILLITHYFSPVLFMEYKESPSL